MREDLQGLEISKNELRELTNLPLYYELIIIIRPLERFIKNMIDKIKGPEGATFIYIGITISVICYLIFDFIAENFTPIMAPSWILFLVFCLGISIITQLLLYLNWRQKNQIVKTNITPSLQILLMDVDRYNAVIKAIDINDQIEAAGNIGVTIKERNKVIEALKLARADLVRALKTERILRENKNFIISNTELFANNLAALTAMQITEKASEHGKLLNEALQIALDVQHEMGKLQNQH
ncbi:MAG: hypothetical protein N2235_16100 [Fischerella sp.]|nr:hypothetical protein [Fischerella sp.]